MPAQQLSKRPAYALANSHHLAVIDRTIRDACRQICDAGNAHDVHAHMAGYDGFGDGAHADRVRSKSSDHVNLRRRLVTRPGERGINSAAQLDTHYTTFLDHDALQLRRVDRAQIGKAGAKPHVIVSSERIVAEEVHMI